ncbi:hypothetical protein [Nocardioides nanhaiensis]|uniref:WD40 repeat domain-containing protein n=1 Tax=Nocardioides nanhaiensis TaxID=1476871 RepID=A0ABP8W878_9ACTN
MTERLAQLLHEEASGLEVPAPDARAVLAAGRGVRRRRRATSAVGALALVAAVGGSVLAVDALAGGSGTDAVDPATPSDAGPVFSLGTTVYLEGGSEQARIDDKAIKSLFYTSAGVLVRHGENQNSDGGGPQRFSLVRPDGSVSPIGVVTEEAVPGTDPEQPYLAYASPAAGGSYEVTVHDLRSDDEVASITLPAAANSDGAWGVPPVALDGDRVWVGSSPQPYLVDWRAGTATPTDAIDPGIPSVTGGRVVRADTDEATVVDLASGEELLSTPLVNDGDTDSWADLSPDGRYLMVTAEDMTSPGATGFEVYDVGTGEAVTVEHPPYDVGWTGSGDLFFLTETDLTTCEADTGECTTRPHGIDVPAPTPQREVCERGATGEICYFEGGGGWDETLRVGGRTYES